MPRSDLTEGGGKQAKRETYRKIIDGTEEAREDKEKEKNHNWVKLEQVKRN